MPLPRYPLTRGGGTLVRLALAACLAGRVAAAADGTPAEVERAAAGPDEVRDEQLFAQPRLTLPPVSPHVVPRGRWTLRASALCSNSFAWWQDVPGEQPAFRDLLVDGEAFTLDLSVRRGLGGGLDVGLRLPLRKRDGGKLDGLIDAWHGFWNLPDDHRPEFRRDAFRVEGVARDGQVYSWNHRAGWGLGDVELESRLRLRDGGGDAASFAVVGRLSLPTGRGPFDGHAVGGSGQLALAVPLNGHSWLYAGFGGTVQGGGPVAGVGFAPKRIHGFLAVEWRPWRHLSFVAETDAASRLVTSIEGYPGIHWGLNVTVRLHLGTMHLDLGFTENVMDQRATTDFGLHLALVARI